MTDDPKDDASDRTEDDPIVALAQLDPIAYDKQRVRTANAMGVRLHTLDKQVAECRAALAKKPTPCEKKLDLKQLAASAKDIIECNDVLGLFAKELSRRVAGETKTAKLLYLVGTSRRFRKPMHAAVKGALSR